jgi:hypothetical protein
MFWAPWEAIAGKDSMLGCSRRSWEMEEKMEMKLYIYSTLGGSLEMVEGKTK